MVLSRIEINEKLMHHIYCAPNARAKFKKWRVEGGCQVKQPNFGSQVIIEFFYLKEIFDSGKIVAGEATRSIRGTSARTDKNASKLPRNLEGIFKQHDKI